MALEGAGFLAVWGDAQAARLAEFEHWHDTEDIPAQLLVPGFRAARRYEAPAAPRHRFFTLYDLADLSVLADPAYAVQAACTSFHDLTMRGLRENLWRLACVVIESSGRGVLACAGSIVFTLPPGRGHVDRLLSVLEREPAISALHLGRQGDLYVLVIEAGNGARMAAGLSGALYWLHGAGAGVVASQAYNLVLALRRQDLSGALVR